MTRNLWDKQEWEREKGAGRFIFKMESRAQSNTRLRFGDIGACESQDTGRGAKVWGHQEMQRPLGMGSWLRVGESAQQD